MTNTENVGNRSNEPKYFKNKATKQIAEFDVVTGLFYSIGDKYYSPISPLTIVSDPNWEETDEVIPDDDPISTMRKRFFNWINGK
jgi:hypothetical protein